MQTPWIAAWCAIGTGAIAQASVITTTFTADNHYALYTFIPDTESLSLIGGNELGPAGDPGEYNWSVAESLTFTAGDFLYVAAWSDDFLYQALLGQVQVGDGETILTGDARWRVYPTGRNRDDGDSYPAAVDVENDINLANANNLWQSTYVGGENGIAPWGTIANISSEANWIWWNVPGDADPIVGGSGSGEFIIFCLDVTTVPAPGAIALGALGTIVCLRRKR